MSWGPPGCSPALQQHAPAARILLDAPNRYNAGRRIHMAAMLCPSCRKLISQDEPRCPYCGAIRPGMWGLGPKLQSLFGRQLQLVPIISMACIVLYVTALVLDIRGALTPFGGLLGILSPSSRAL